MTLDDEYYVFVYCHTECRLALARLYMVIYHIGLKNKRIVSLLKQCCLSYQNDLSYLTTCEEKKVCLEPDLNRDPMSP